MADETFDEFAEAPKSKKPLIFIVLGVVLLAGNGAAAYFFLGSGGDEAEAGAAAAPADEGPVAFDPGAEPGPMMPLDPFVLNLDEPERARYLRLSMTLELDSEEAGAPLQARMPRLRDRFISHLSSQSVAALSAAEDKDRLREELLEIARGMAGPRAVRAVYFTEFIIQ